MPDDDFSPNMEDLTGEAEKNRKANANGHNPEGGPIGITVAASLADKPVPERRWRVPEWIPSRQVTLLSGDGGVGKTILALQLQIAAASALQSWLGLPVVPSRSLGFYGEDEDDELHIRLAALAELMGVNIATLDRMAWRSAVGDDTELIEIDGRGKVRPTAYFYEVERLALAFRANLLVLDATTNFYGGDELQRRHVNAFVRLLRQLAIKIDGEVVLLAHPSLAGMASGSGLSGSTHWNNSSRSRLYLTRASGDEADPDERVLTKLKANYSSTGDMLRLRWHRGGFVALNEPSGVDRAALDGKADRVFRTMLSTTYGEGTWTSPNPAANNYAPRAFSKRPDREGFGRPAFEAAMFRLSKAGEIKIEDYGPPSQGRRRLAPA